MTTRTEYIETRIYTLLDGLEDEIDALESFKEHSGYICDAISEIADSYIPIYNSEIWENASNISEYIEEAIANGIAPTDVKNVDIVKILQCGYYEYYTQSLYSNLDTLIFNYVAEKINDYLDVQEDNNEIDIEKLGEYIEEEVGSFDNNNTFDDLDNSANSIIEQIEDGEFNK